MNRLKRSLVKMNKADRLKTILKLRKRVHSPTKIYAHKNSLINRVKIQQMNQSLTLKHSLDIPHNVVLDSAHQVSTTINQHKEDIQDKTSQEISRVIP